MCERDICHSNNEQKADRPFDISASPSLNPTVTLPVLDPSDTIVEGPFDTVGNSPGGVGGVLVTWSALLWLRV